MDRIRAGLLGGLATAKEGSRKANRRCKAPSRLVSVGDVTRSNTYSAASGAYGTIPNCEGRTLRGD